MSFDKLAEELNALAAKVTAQVDTPAAGAGGEGGGAGAGDASLAKSFKFTLEDGTEIEAADGVALVKALTDRQDKTEKELMGVIAPMATMLKSLTEQVAKLSAGGTGRRSTTVHMPGAEADAGAGKGNEGRVDMNEVMAKAMTAHAAGRIDSLVVAQLEGYANKGMTPPEHLLVGLK